MNTNVNKTEIKTYKDWTGSITDYLKPGDIVDEEMYNHFLNILPPLVWNGYYLQVREAQSYVCGGNTYLTFSYENGNWIYKGECHRNQTQHLG